MNEEDLTTLPEHLRAQAGEFLERIAEGKTEFFEFRHEMVMQDIGPECFLTFQAALAMRRAVDMRMSGQRELASDMTWGEFIKIFYDDLVNARIQRATQSSSYGRGGKGKGSRRLMRTSDSK